VKSKIIRTKAEQSETTTRRLVSIARALFAERGYARTGTEDLVQTAGVTRGALYHHFENKESLFRAVLDDVQREVGERVEAAAAKPTDAWAQLLAGCHAFLSAATDPEVQRIMLVDAPAVLGWDAWREMDSQYSLKSLKMALHEMAGAGEITAPHAEAMAHLLSGAMNEAALWIARSDHPRKALNEAMASLELLMSAMRARRTK
jgi:AcrR family transcriptional regulator